MSLPPDRDTWARVSALLDQAFELEGDSLTAFLEEVEAEDPSVCTMVAGMLQADSRPRGLLDDTLDQVAAPLFAEEAVHSGTLPAGTLIGNYRIVREVGHGGMGRVYEAERADGAYDQRVALKVIRSGLSWGALRDRFLQERQILASLDHPNLARLLDGGVTDDGRPYFAMEFVEGRPLTQYASDHDLNLRQRLRLFADACAAVTHAQRRLVVHRDLKPSNILVTEQGEVKLLDFGIARLLGTSEDQGLTQFGPRLLTPEFAAPEQLEGGTITTATDVYALGRILEELLPTVESGGPSLEIPRDLQRIIRKARSEDPDQRYPAAAGLGEDIDRYLSGYPVRARRPSWGYVAGRFMARNKLAVGAAVAVILTLIAGVVATSWQADRAEKAAARATKVTEFLVSLFSEADPDVEQGRETSAREILARGAARIEAELSGDPELQAELYNLTGELLLKRGDYAHAEAQFGQALALREATLEPD
ncbi:MAG: serine/threonine-protein kinase, partial [Xanthomonadales bacterium]|nr:serine/threonine-protein kinase [Xanthomonadales bacterium]